MSQFHSVVLDREKCKGCTNCIQGCPTEAIRVRHGKAQIMEDRCIDCGECIRICPNHAKSAETDRLSRIRDFPYPVALPAPALLGQFKTEFSPDRILGAFLALGFVDVMEVAVGADIATWATAKLLAEKRIPRPAISSSCPAVVRLIQLRFPELIDHLVPVESPMEIVAHYVKKEKSRILGVKPEEVGTFFITPCPAKVTAAKRPVGRTISAVDGCISIAEVYRELLKALDNQKQTLPQPTASALGAGWGVAGGEKKSLHLGEAIHVDGIHRVIELLEEVELGKLKDIDYLECQACIGGCVGGPLAVEKSFLAEIKLNSQTAKLPSVNRRFSPADLPALAEFYRLDAPIEAKPFIVLDEDMGRAIAKMEQLAETEKRLPGLDCGSCGAPNCRALAEDIVRGEADESDCIFKLRERLRDLAEEMFFLSKKVPPSLSPDSAGEGEVKT